MAKSCSHCGKEVKFLQGKYYYQNGKPIFSCYECMIKEKDKEKKEYEEEQRKKLEEIIAKAPKIECPYCKQWFPKLTNEQYRDNSALNVLKWAVVPAWGLAGSLKNKPFIECPHCKMKIMQG